MRQFIAVMAVLCSGSSAFATSTVRNPIIQNRPVDFCLVPTKQCGKPAADRYCQMMRLGRAVEFEGVRSREQTIILGTGELCNTSRFDHL
jgi:hypothetical protein